MGKRSRLDGADVLSVMRHLADVAALRGDPAAQRQLFIDGLSSIVGTDSAFFYVADEWRTGRRPHFTGYTLTSQHDPTFIRYTSEFGIKFPLDDDPYCYQSVRNRALLQTWTSRDVIPDREAAGRHVNFMELRSTSRLADGVVTFYRSGADDDRIVGVGMHRFGVGSKTLTPREVAMATLAVEELQRLDERGYLSLPTARGEGVTGLPQRLRQVLNRLLAGQAPKTIARELGLSVWTVREHVQRLYRHFGVGGREELTARFVTWNGTPNG